MRYWTKENRGYLSFPLLDKYAPRLLQAISLRSGGMSGPPYHGRNLALHVGDEPGRVMCNRQLVSEDLGVPLEAVTVAEQVHGCNVSVVTAAERGRGIQSHADALGGADAMITNVPGVALLVLVADCPAVLLYDPDRQVVGLVHAGWRGTLECITQKAIAQMTSHYGVCPRSLLAAISPAIGRCCYAISEQLVELFLARFSAFRAADILAIANEHSFLDLVAVNRLQLAEAGLSPSRVSVSRLCTGCNSDLFFSYRRDGASTGRFGVLVCLR